jgi:hypothetical protein
MGDAEEERKKETERRAQKLMGGHGINTSTSKVKDVSTVTAHLYSLPLHIQDIQTVLKEKPHRDLLVLSTQPRHPLALSINRKPHTAHPEQENPRTNHQCPESNHEDPCQVHCRVALMDIVIFLRVL